MKEQNYEVMCSLLRLLYLLGIGRTTICYERPADDINIIEPRSSILNMMYRQLYGLEYDWAYHRITTIFRFRGSPSVLFFWAEGLPSIELLHASDRPTYRPCPIALPAPIHL